VSKRDLGLSPCGGDINTKAPQMYKVYPSANKYFHSLLQPGRVATLIEDKEVSKVMEYDL